MQCCSVLQSIEIDSNSGRNERKQWSKQRLKRLEKAIKGSVHTNETYGYLFCLCARWHVFQIENNLRAVLQCFVIDWNRFKQRSKPAKTVIQTANEAIKTIKTAIKGSVLEVYTHLMTYFPVLTQRAKQPG